MRGIQLIITMQAELSYRSKLLIILQSTNGLNLSMNFLIDGHLNFAQTNLMLRVAY